jgi:hypothetical protein
MGVFVAVKKNVNRLFLTTAKVISEIQTGGPWLGAGNGAHGFRTDRTSLLLGSVSLGRLKLAPLRRS